MATSAELREQLRAKQDALHALFSKYENVADMSADDALLVKGMNDELTAIADELERVEALEEVKSANDAARERRERRGSGPPREDREGAGDGSRVKVKSFGEILRGSRSYAAFLAGESKTAVFDLGELETKTLLTLSDINAAPTRLPQIVPYAADETTVADLMLQGTIDGNTITYMEETTFTNAAAAVAEGSAKPESTLDFTERTENVRKIATWLPATSELLADVSGIQSYIEGRLAFMVRAVEEQQLLTGDGTAPNISGILDRSGIQTQAKGADPTPDAVYKAMTKVRVTGQAEPTAYVTHPNDWQDVRLLRTTDGIYIWGSPADAGPERIWGLEVRQTPKMTENTGLVGAFRPHSQIFRRSGITITISTEHSTYFTENKVAILAEERLALAVYRPAAFCTVTGI